MRRLAPALPVSSAMFRHFAVLTVVITGCLAMFANGENRRALEDEIRARQLKNHAMAVDKEAGRGQTVNGLIVAKGLKLEDHWGEDARLLDTEGLGASDRGGPPALALPPTLPDSNNRPGPPAAPATDSAGIPIPGAGMGPPNIRKEGKPSPPRKITATDIQRMLDASKQRSGAAGAE